jgi:hypothetical protein
VPNSRRAKSPLRDVSQEEPLVALQHALEDLRNVANVLAARVEKLEARPTPPSPPAMTKRQTASLERIAKLAAETAVDERLSGLRDEMNSVNDKVERLVHVVASVARRQDQQDGVNFGVVDTLEKLIGVDMAAAKDLRAVVDEHREEEDTDA